MRIALAIGLLWTALAARAQVYIHGAPIRVTGQAELTVQGSLVSHGAANQSEAPVVLEGRIRLGGNLADSTTQGIIRPGSNGLLELLGGADQTLLGKARLYLPTLELRKTGGQVTAGTDLEITQELRFGSATILQAAGGDIFLSDMGSMLQGEAGDRYVGGEEASVTGPADFFLAAESTSTDLLGIGLEAGTLGGAAVDPFRGKRVHRIEAGVGKQGSIRRVYEMEAGNPSMLSSLVVNYLPHEIPAGYDESQFKLFASHDNGATWLPVDGTLDAAANRLAVNSYALPQVPTWLTVAEACDPVVPAITSSKALQNGVINQCPGESITLSYGGSAVAYHWSIEGSTDTLAMNAAIDVADPGRYQLTVRTSRGCVNTNVIEIVPRSNPMLDITFTPDPATQLICLGTEVDFSVSSDQPLTTANWELAGEASNGEHVTRAFTSPGNKSIEVTGTSTYGCVSSIQEPLRILPRPTVSINLPETTFCQEETISAEAISDLRFEGSSFSLEYTWSYESAQFAGPTFEGTATSPGQNRLQLSVQPTLPHAGCQVITENYVNVDHKPEAAFEVRKDGEQITNSCEGEYIQFENQSFVNDNSTLTFSWDFDDGQVAGEESPQHQFLGRASRTISLITLSETTGCADTAFETHVVNEVPKGQFFLSANRLCAGDTLLIQNDSYTIVDDFISEWSFGQGTAEINNQNQFSVSYSQSGDYRIRLERTTSKGCSNSIDKTVSVYDMPQVDFRLDQTVCVGQQVIAENLTTLNRGSISQFQWFVDGDLVSASSAFSRTFVSDSNRTVRLKAITSEGCSAAREKELIVRRAFEVDDIDRLYCQDSAIIDLSQSVTPSIANATVDWFSPAGDHIGNEKSKVLKENGSYTLNISDEYCSSELLVPVHLAFAVNLEREIEICNQEFFDPEFSIVPDTIGWYYDGSTISDSKEVLLRQEGIYQLQATFSIDDETCAVDEQLEVTRVDRPVYSFADTLISCEGQQVTLEADDSSFKYDWVNLTTGETFSNTPTFTANANRLVEIVALKSACAFRDTVQIQFKANPVVSFLSDKMNYCLDDTVRLTNQSFDHTKSDLTYAWYLDGEYLTNAEHTFYPISGSSPTEVSLAATNSFGCSQSFSKTIAITTIAPGEIEVEQICTSDKVTLTAEDEGQGLGYLWEFEDGQQLAGSTVRKAFDQYGTQWVDITFEKGDCRADSLLQIEVKQPLERPFERNYATCSDSLTLEYSGKDELTWMGSSDSLISFSKNQLVARSSAAIFYQITNVEKCSLQDTLVVEIGSLPTNLLPDTIGSCDAIDVNIPVVENAEYIWSDGFGGRKRAIESSGTYGVKIRTPDGCEATDTMAVQIEKLPTLDFPSRIDACEGDTIQLEVPGSVSDFTWSNGSLNRSLLLRQDIDLSLTIRNTYCVQNQSTEVRFQPLPDLTLPSDSSLCAGDMFELNLPANEGVEYSWLLDNALSSHGNYFFLKSDIAKTFEVTAKASNQFGCEVMGTFQLTFYPTPEFNISSSPVCEGDTARFTVSNPTGENFDYQWNSGVQPSPWLEGEFLVPGFSGKTISGQVINDFGCHTSIEVNPELKERPLLDIQSQLVSCLDTLTLELPDEYGEVRWSNGGEGLKASFVESGIETVYVRGENACSNSLSFEVILNNIQESQLANEYVNCGSLDLEVADSDNSMIWLRGNTILSRTNELKVAGSGNYSYEVMDGNGCMYNHDFEVEIKEAPDLNLLNKYQICGDAYTVRIDSTNLAFVQWGDGSITFEKQLLKSSQYNIEAVGQNGCSVSDSFDLQLMPRPPDRFDSQLENCGPFTLSVPDSLSALWDNGSISNGRLADENGLYWVRMTNDAGCSTVDSVEVVIKPIPQIELGPDETLCYGETIDLTIDEDYEQVIWNNGDNQPSIRVSTPGSYWVQVTNEFQCSASDVIQIDYRDRLVPDLGGTKYICSRDGVWLWTNLVAETYSWTLQGNVLSNDDSLRVVQPGEYKLTVRDQFGCSGEELIRVAESSSPIEASFLATSVARPGEEVVFSLLTEPLPGSVFWDFGDGTTSDLYFPTHRFVTTGIKKVVLEVFNEQCADVEEKDILITDEDVVDFSGDSSDLMLKTLEISPNPTIGDLKVAIELNYPGEADILIFDIVGNERLRRKEFVLEDSVFLDLHDFNTGVYYLFIQVGRKVIMRRIIKI